MRVLPLAYHMLANTTTLLLVHTQLSLCKDDLAHASPSTVRALPRHSNTQRYQVPEHDPTQPASPPLLGSLKPYLSHTIIVCDIRAARPHRTSHSRALTITLLHLYSTTNSHLKV
ncbi:hypothetical protein B0H34DRAFT_794314 [Crassisporium funariophilum]|nr:hypothetical protein B0H34DRAFT_794314 [Crassisporium funariophilum]